MTQIHTCNKDVEGMSCKCEKSNLCELTGKECNHKPFKYSEELKEAAKRCEEAEMSNLDQIIAASKMGYSAKIHNLEDGDFWKVVGVYSEILLIDDYDQWWYANEEDLENVKITSYLYVGHLFGEPVIPEGQRFRVKRLGNIWKATGERSWSKSHVELKKGKIKEDFEMSELIPVFD